MSLGVIWQKGPTYVEWEIANFTSSVEGETYLTSPEFCLTDKTAWYLEIYSTTATASERCLHVYLYKLDSDKQYDIAFKVGVLKCDGSEFNVKNASYKFKKKPNHFLFEDFCLLSDIKTSDDVTSNGVVKFFCKIYFFQNSNTVKCK